MADDACARPGNAGDHVQQGRLAAPRRSDERHERAGRYGEVNRRECLHTGTLERKRLRDALHLDQVGTCRVGNGTGPTRVIGPLLECLIVLSIGQLENN